MQIVTVNQHHCIRFATSPDMLTSHLAMPVVMMLEWLMWESRNWNFHHVNANLRKCCRERTVRITAAWKQHFSSFSLLLDHLSWVIVWYLKGACAIYEPVLLRQRLHFTYVAFRLASALADLYVIKHAGGINILGEEDERQKYPEDMEAPQIAGQSVRCTLCWGAIVHRAR